MRYEDHIDLENVTLQDCVDLYDKKAISTIINDGRIVDFSKGEWSEF